MKKFNGKTTLGDVYNIYRREVMFDEVRYYHELLSSKGHDCWGIVNASKKHSVRLMLDHTDLPYTPALGSVLREFLFGSAMLSEENYQRVCHMRVDEAIYNLTMTGYIV